MKSDIINYPMHVGFFRAVRKSFLTYKGTEFGVNLFESGSTGTGISSMVFILICQLSIIAPYHTTPANRKTMVKAVVLCGGWFPPGKYIEFNQLTSPGFIAFKKTTAGNNGQGRLFLKCY
jgi:hypothetical protein